MSSSKPKCKYSDTCYRKDKKHLSEFLHPTVDKTKKPSPVKDEPAPEPKPSLRKRKTHEMSVYEGEVEEVKKLEPPAKKVKIDVNEEAMDTTEAAKPKKASPRKGKGKGRGRAKCNFWDKCYRKDADHKKQFKHPGDSDEDEEDEWEGPSTSGKQTRSSTRPQPLNRMDSVDSVDVGGFTLKRTGSAYECTCGSFTGFKNFGKASNMKTCTHLIKHNGEDFERSRCELPPKGKKEIIKSHISISVLLAHKYVEGSMNPKGWWLSEKLDGVRAYWNGKCFYSRLGNAFIAPNWFTKDLPRDMHLDGELFGGRKKFQSTVSIVKTPEHKDWNKVKYHVFDVPHIEKEPFEKRLKVMEDLFQRVKPANAILCAQSKCTGQEQIDKELKRIIAAGGEGLMIRQPGSKYERTRSKTLLKIKKFYDAEARVIGYEKSKSNPSHVGALKVVMACGKQFKVGSGLTNKNRVSPPKIGSIITYKFQELTNSGSPRFPTFIGLRIDMTEPKDPEGLVLTATDD